MASRWVRRMMRASWWQAQSDEWRYRGRALLGASQVRLQRLQRTVSLLPRSWPTLVWSMLPRSVAAMVPEALRGGAGSSGTGVAFMVTQDMKQQLHDLGYARRTIDTMTPAAAHHVLVHRVAPSIEQARRSWLREQGLLESASSSSTDSITIALGPSAVTATPASTSTDRCDTSTTSTSTASEGSIRINSSSNNSGSSSSNNL